MKLNDHGWGMRDMIIYTCVLILFLLLAVYLVNTLYDNMAVSDSNQSHETAKKEEDTDKSPETPVIDYDYYKNLETKLELSTYNYLNEKKPEISTNILKINLTEIQSSGYIEKIYDQNSEKECKAYSSVSKNEYNDYVIIPFISCDNYTTEGY